MDYWCMEMEDSRRRRGYYRRYINKYRWYSINTVMAQHRMMLWL
jgi:hypothetical protein